MERRREARLHSDTPATIRRLDLSDRSREVRILNVSSLGVALKSPIAFPLHTPVWLDWNGGLLLGEVVHSLSDGPGFTLGVSIQHSLYDLAGLAAARAAFLA